MTLEVQGPGVGVGGLAGGGAFVAEHDARRPR